MIQSESKGLGAGTDDVSPSVSPKAKEPETLMSSTQDGYLSSSREEEFTLPLPFVPFKTSRVWMILTCIDEGSLLSLDY